MPDAPAVFESYRAALVGLPLSHAWRGYGSALMLEFGPLTPSAKHDGSPGQPRGAYSALLEWSWRIEAETSIICGAWSDEALWPGAFADLIGRTVTALTLFGRLPELSISLSGPRHISSFMPADGHPAWTLLRNTPPPTSLSVTHGRLTLGP